MVSTVLTRRGKLGRQASVKALAADDAIRFKWKRLLGLKERAVRVGNVCRTIDISEASFSP
jgi:hypothetical protein